jgi:hypothetical protein
MDAILNKILPQEIKFDIARKSTIKDNILIISFKHSFGTIAGVSGNLRSGICYECMPYNAYNIKHSTSFKDATYKNFNNRKYLFFTPKKTSGWIKYDAAYPLICNPAIYYITSVLYYM